MLGNSTNIEYLPADIVFDNSHMLVIEISFSYWKWEC